MIQATTLVRTTSGYTPMKVASQLTSDSTAYALHMGGGIHTTPCGCAPF